MAGTPVVAVVRAVSLHHDGCAMSRPRPAALRTSLVTRKFTRSAIDNAIPRLKLTAEVKPMLIGRDAEAAKITSFLGELAGGSRVLLIEGEAGIGKTTLLREGHAVATQLGMTVLSAFPVKSEIPLEFAGLTDLLQKVPAAMIDALPVPQRQVLRQAVLRTMPQQRAADPRTRGPRRRRCSRCSAA